MAVGARAATVHALQVERTDWTREVVGSEDGLTRTTPVTWATTSTRTPVGTTSVDAHDVSKPMVTVAK